MRRKNCDVNCIVRSVGTGHDSDILLKHLANSKAIEK